MKEVTLEEILAAEMDARTRLNEFQRERDALERKCRSTLESLNALKRRAYLMGFQGNIMRDAMGNRVNSLSSQVKP